ncbi:MAG: hypothetical protein LZF86_90011 [Nitrospira sp.]|nr:MAG: hypothetical protein LZF86_90011 [Nitrospira sp.]
MIFAFEKDLFLLKVEDTRTGSLNYMNCVLAHKMTQDKTRRGGADPPQALRPPPEAILAFAYNQVTRSAGRI